jgi:phage protein D
MNGDSYVEPKAAWQVMLDGKDLTAIMAPRLINLKLDEATDEKADKLEIVLRDDDGQMAIPPEGALLTVALGWARGSGVTVGLVSKGTFKVDDVSWYGPPDRISISAHSADLAGSFRQRKNKVWNGKTLGAIVAEVATANGLTAKCHSDLASTVVTSEEQAHKSDMQFLRDLGRRYDAVATVKAGSLIFTPKNAVTTVNGDTIPTITITRKDCDTATYRRSAREAEQDGAEAQYNDQGSSKRGTVGAGGANRKRMKRVFASKADASAAAGSESNKLARKKASFSMTLALGNASARAGIKAKVSGFKSEVDAKAWRIASVTHDMDGSGGFRTDLELEVAG